MSSVDAQYLPEPDSHPLSPLERRMQEVDVYLVTRGKDPVTVRNTAAYRLFLRSKLGRTPPKTS